MTYVANFSVFKNRPIECSAVNLETGDPLGRKIHVSATVDMTSDYFSYQILFTNPEQKTLRGESVNAKPGKFCCRFQNR